MQPTGDYCSYTKVVEHFGFNVLVSSLFGISRLVFVCRLRKLEVMGLIAREFLIRGKPVLHHLTFAG